jgi:hypothetical protein
MDEMLTLQEFRAAVAPPDDAALMRARARMLDLGMAGQGGRRLRWPRLPGTLPDQPSDRCRDGCGIRSPGLSRQHADPSCCHHCQGTCLPGGSCRGGAAGRGPRTVGVLAGDDSLGVLGCAAALAAQQALPDDLPVVDHSRLRQGCFHRPRQHPLPMPQSDRSRPIPDHRSAKSDCIAESVNLNEAPSGGLGLCSERCFRPDTPG